MNAVVEYITISTHPRILNSCQNTVLTIAHREIQSLAFTQLILRIE
jgi:hypothetical protein